jgi:4-methyl-5(b-hydroxyethyl)-thiazole monophosphate biosynthesis
VGDVIVPLAEGFEEIEAVTVIDILRRAEVGVFVAGVEGLQIVGSHGIRVVCDGLIEDCIGEEISGIVLPGGLPGTTNLGHSTGVCQLVERAAKRGTIVAAICAAPTVLSQLGLLKGKKATSHPNHSGDLGDCFYLEEAVVVDGNVITSRGAGTALCFAAELVRILVGDKKADKILESIVAR